MRELKDAVEAATGLPPVRQRLIALGRLLDERRVWLSDHLLISRVRASVDSQSLQQLALRHRTGASLLGVLHDDRVDMDIRGDTVIQRGDELVLCGDRSALAAATDLLTA